MRQEPGKPATQKISFDQLKSQVTGVEPVAPTAFKEIVQTADEAKKWSEIKALESITELRQGWSIYLMVMLAAATVFQGVLVISVGLGWWAFANNQVFLNTVAGELFLQIAGLGVLVVKFLFSAQQNPIRDSKSKRR